MSMGELSLIPICLVVAWVGELPPSLPEAGARAVPVVIRAGELVLNPAVATLRIQTLNLTWVMQ